jgi:hypothetical protein
MKISKPNLPHMINTTDSQTCLSGVVQIMCTSITSTYPAKMITELWYQMWVSYLCKQLKYLTELAQ